MTSQRLPIPGQDNDAWGDILNGFLGVAHNADGTLLLSAITAAGGGTYSKPSGGIPGTDLTSAVQTQLAQAGSGYVKPAGGIPSGDMTTAVQTSLGKADSALQTAPVSSVAGKTGVVTLVEADIASLTTDLAATEKSANKGVASGYAPLNGSSQVPIVNIPTGTTSSTVAIGNDNRILAAIPNTTATTKGDLLAASAANTITRLGVGSNNQVLTADSTQATGLKWSTINVPSSLTIGSSTTTAGALIINQLTPVDATAGTVAMTLPTGQAAGTLIAVRKQDASTNAVTITGNIAGVAATTISLVLVAETITFETDSAGSWWTVSGNKTITSLDGRYPLRANNLNDLASTSSARTNLGLGAAATLNVGTTTGTVAAGDDSRLTGSLQTSTVITKGDILAASAASTIARVGVGSNNQVLTADSTQTTGVKWASPNNLNGVSVSGTPAAGQTLVATTSSAAAWTYLPVMLPYSMSGTLTTKVSALKQYVEYPYVITNVRAAVGTAPTGASVIVDVLINGTTIYATQSNRPTIATSTTTATGNSFSTSVLNAGDYLTITVAQVGSTIAGADLTVTITLSYV